MVKTKSYGRVFILVFLLGTLTLFNRCVSKKNSVAEPYVVEQNSVASKEMESVNSNANTNDLRSKISRANEEVVSGETIKAELTSPPYVPAPLGDRGPKKVLVELEIIEKEGILSDGISYLYWTFGGTVPGSFIRVKEGDEVDFRLQNHPDNKLAHSIDLHAVNGPGGGAEATFIAPGREKSFTFKALNPGLYVYHCAAAPIGLHIANGMYGLILVEPKGGLSKVDKEYYIMQGEFYTEGDFGETGFQPFNLKKALNENPDYVVLNGKVGSLTGDNAIKAEVGDIVRLYVGNGGPNKVSSFHVIGELFDKVHVEGGTLINENIQTTLIPAAGSAIVEFVVEAPGDYIMLDHSIFRATNKGALGILSVKGEDNKKIYSGQQIDKAYASMKTTDESFVGMVKSTNSSKKDPSSKEYSPDSNIKREMDAKADALQSPLEQQLNRGKKVFSTVCFACHQSDAKGVPGVFPPLAASDYLNANVDRAIGIALNGKKGKITVNGTQYDGIMPNLGLTDREVADVLTYIYNNFENNKTVVNAEKVKKIRGK